MFLTDSGGCHVPRNIFHALEGEVMLDEEVRHGYHVHTQGLITVMRVCRRSCGLIGEGR